MYLKTLVTGGAGFIGSNLVDSLLQEKGEIVVIDNFEPFYDKSTKYKNVRSHFRSNHYSLIKADIRDQERVNGVFERFKPDVVVHLAAKAGVRASVEDPHIYSDVNITGTVNILNAAVKYDIKKVIFASSSSVYGLNDKVPFSEDDPIMQPASPYGASKIAAEALCYSYSNCYNLPIISLRFFTVYGPRQRPDLAIYKFVRKILRGERITLYGDGSSSRDYTYIDDIIYGIRKALEYKVDGYEVFNLGNDKPTKLIDLVQMIEDVLGQKAQIEWLPMQTGDVPRTWASLKKSEKILGYRPETELYDGLLKFKDWLDGSF